jgi:hypothetical protein
MERLASQHGCPLCTFYHTFWRLCNLTNDHPQAGQVMDDHSPRPQIVSLPSSVCPRTNVGVGSALGATADAGNATLKRCGVDAASQKRLRVVQTPDAASVRHLPYAHLVYFSQQCVDLMIYAVSGYRQKILTYIDIHISSIRPR